MEHLAVGQRVEWEGAGLVSNSHKRARFKLFVRMAGVEVILFTVIVLLCSDWQPLPSLVVPSQILLTHARVDCSVVHTSTTHNENEHS